ncbi:MAG: MurR/RpiR family transcriptional regulator [Chloroflexota bacterium]|nr:MurR/RpiR family transcriptional regulator [Chloroflexota bacterium]
MFRQKIQDKHDDLTPSFRKLADFIQNNELDAAFMTATELADRLGVDAATVVRFAQELGYSGFRELSKEIQEVVRADLKASYTADLNAPQDLELFRGLLVNEKHNLELAQDRLTERVDSLLPTLTEAARIWVVGQGQCANLAALCADALREVGLPAVAIPSDPLMAATNLKGIDDTDVVIGFSRAGMDLDTASVVSFARRRGAPTFVFSVSPVAAAALEAETSIVCPGQTETGVPSFTGLAAMIVVLVSAFTVRYPEEGEAMTIAMRESYRELLEERDEMASRLDIEDLWRHS